jgi:hypothetical protein
LHPKSNSKKQDLLGPKDELKKKIVTLAGVIRDWNNETVKVRKTVKKQFEEIQNLGLNKYNMERTVLRRLVVELFQLHGVSDSWIRKLLPMELKDTSKIRLSYLQKQEIEKERQRLLCQQTSGSPQELEIRDYDLSSATIVEPFVIQPLEPVATKSSSEIRQEIGMGYQSEYHSQDHETLPSSHSNEPIKVQNELSEAYKKIEKLEAEVQVLSEQFIAQANIEALGEIIPLIVRIDPMKKVIISIGFVNGPNN